MLVYRIVPRPLWAEAVATGSFNGSPIDVADGFIHFSTAAQLRETARKHFAGVSNLLLVAVPADALGKAIKWEPSRGGDLFPHLCGPLPVHLAASVMPMPIGMDGIPIVPEL